MQYAGFGEHVEEIIGDGFAEDFAGKERQLERSATNVIEQDQQLVRRDSRGFGWRIFEEFGMTHHVLVQRVARRNHHAQRRLLAPTCATQALPGCGNRTGVAVEDRDIERSDVDPEFQC